jgi:hypothetical protein
MTTRPILPCLIPSTTTTHTKSTGPPMRLHGLLMDKLAEPRSDLRRGMRHRTNGTSLKPHLVSNFLCGLLVSLPTVKELLTGPVVWLTGILPTSRTMDTTTPVSNPWRSPATTPNPHPEQTAASHTPITTERARTTPW